MTLPNSWLGQYLISRRNLRTRRAFCAAAVTRKKYKSKTQANMNKYTNKYEETRSLVALSGAQLLCSGPSGRLWALQACLTTSFTPFGRSGRVTHVAVQWLDSASEKSKKSQRHFSGPWRGKQIIPLEVYHIMVHHNVEPLLVVTKCQDYVPLGRGCPGRLKSKFAWEWHVVL